MYLALGIGLFHGTVYVFLVPPWQHNDEPNHFEYAWLIAHRSSLPHVSDYDPQMTFEVMQSMISHHFFKGMSYSPEIDINQPRRLPGYSQLTDPPLYYIIASIPLRIINFLSPGTDIDIQLYSTRLVSLFLLLISIFATWGLVSELSGPTHPLTWLVPISMALWPGYVDMMTAVTDIAGAVGFFCLFMWFCISLIHRGLSWIDLCIAVLTTLACLFTMSIVFIAVPLLVTAIIFSLLRYRWRWLPWAVLLLGVISGIFIMITWGDAYLWYRDTRQVKNNRSTQVDAPLGKNAFQLIVPPDGLPASLYQLLPPSKIRGLTGKTITLGAWIWATHPIQINSPILYLYDKKTQYYGTFDITEVPTFHVITATLTSDTARSWIILSINPSAADAGTEVFFDGVVLADGSYPINETPVFENTDGTQGMWGQLSFVNLIRNPSAEVSGSRIRLWADSRYLKNNYGSLSMLLYAVQDWPGAGWYYRGTAANLFRTLWGRFGWNNVPYLGYKPYRGFLYVTFLGIAGFIISAWRKVKTINWEIGSWIGITLALSGFVTVTRGVFSLWYQPFIPSARYLFPIMSLIVFFFCAGYWEIIHIFKRWLPIKVLGLIFTTFFIVVDVYALASLVSFYY